MNLPEEKSYSFIIRIWFEELSSQTGQKMLRGHITHIPSNTRRHFEDLEDMKQFVKLFIDDNDPDQRVTNKEV